MSNTPKDLSNKLVVGISSRALFDLSASHEVYEQQGLKAYQQYQIDNEKQILPPGTAFNLVSKLLAIRDPDTNEALVEVILLSRNSTDTGLRIFNSIKHYGLDISRAAFTNGESPYKYVQAFSAHLFLSAHAEDVRAALEAGCAAAMIMPRPIPISSSEGTADSANAANSANQDETSKAAGTIPLKIAFDGDAVLFSDEAEQIYQAAGLDAFNANEIAHATDPLMAGPLAGFLRCLHGIQQKFPRDDCPIRTALVTARSAPAHERVIETFRSWQIRIDEALFLGGLTKTEFLRAFKADFFFDDQTQHCLAAGGHVPTGHVPHGVMN